MILFQNRFRLNRGGVHIGCRGNIRKRWIQWMSAFFS